MYNILSLWNNLDWIREEKLSRDEILDHYDECRFMFEHFLKCQRCVLRLDRLLLMVGQYFFKLLFDQLWNTEIWNTLLLLRGTCRGWTESKQLLNDCVVTISPLLQTDARLQALD